MDAPSIDEVLQKEWAHHRVSPFWETPNTDNPQVMSSCLATVRSYNRLSPTSQKTLLMTNFKVIMASYTPLLHDCILAIWQPSRLFGHLQCPTVM